MFVLSGCTTELEVRLRPDPQTTTTSSLAKSCWFFEEAFHPINTSVGLGPRSLEAPQKLGTGDFVFGRFDATRRLTRCSLNQSISSAFPFTTPLIIACSKARYQVIQRHLIKQTAFENGVPKSDPTPGSLLTARRVPSCKRNL
jgi:hypothetical protein